VPASSGIRPNWPSLAPAAGSGEKRGSQTVPKKKLVGGTFSKKAMVWTASTATMPMVVRMAIDEAPSRLPA
jgi:hypothetical protein